MNLHSIVAGAIGAINPFIPAVLRQSAGYTTAADGSQVPLYKESSMMVQVQGLSSADMRQVQGLNIQGNMNAVYLSGDWEGIVRPDGRGGDVLVFGGQTWLVVASLENWPDWTKLAVVLQNGG